MLVRKILLCYESTIENSYLKYALENANNILVYANDGEEVIDKAKSEKPDLIYMDIMRLGSRGYQVIQTLRNGSETRSIPVIFFSGKHQEADRIWSQLQDSRNLMTTFDLGVSGDKKSISC